LGVDKLLEGSGARHIDLWRHALQGPGVFAEEIADVRHWFAENPTASFDLVIHLAAVVGGRATIEGNPL